MNHHHWEYIWMIIIFHIIHVKHWKPSRMFSTWTHQAFMWNMARNSSALIRPSPSLERHFFSNNPNNQWLFGIISALQCRYNHSSCWPSIGLVQINTYQGSPGASPFWPKVGCLWISGTPPCSNIVIIFHNMSHPPVNVATVVLVYWPVSNSLNYLQTNISVHPSHENTNTWTPCQLSCQIFLLVPLEDQPACTCSWSQVKHSDYWLI